jgi:hypothetical protein
MIKVGQIRLENPVLLVIGASVTTAIVLFSDNPLLYSSVAIGAALLLGYALSAVMNGNSQGLVSIWALFYPLAYYYLSFPQDHPIFTLDRALVAILAAVLMAESLEHPQPLPSSIRYAGLCWAGFIGAALLSIRDVRGHNLVYTLRLLIDTFVGPGVLALYVLRRFNVRRYGPILCLVVCAMSIYVAGIGVAEDVLHKDLLPLSDDATLALGDDVIFRANGPFASGGTIALVGVINFLLIRFFQRTTGPVLPYWQRAVQWIGMLASFACSMVSMHRAILVVWVVILLIETCQNRKNPVWWRRTAWKRVALLVVCYAALFATKVMLPDIYEDRVDNPGNIYGRLAQYGQSWAVLVDHLWLGAGFGQFGNVVVDESKYRFFFRGVGSLDSPHNTLVNIAADTGLVGLCFFTLSQLFLLAACRKLRLKRALGTLTWWTIISIFAAYWVVGMDLGSGYYSELNMWYMFAIAICFRYSYSKPETSELDLGAMKGLRNPATHTYSIPN